MPTSHVFLDLAIAVQSQIPYLTFDKPPTTFVHTYTAQHPTLRWSLVMPPAAKSAVSYAKITLPYPIFAAEFDPYNRGYLVVGGGGGESKTGVPNQIVSTVSASQEALQDSHNYISLSSMSPIVPHSPSPQISICLAKKTLYSLSPVLPPRMV